MTQKENPSLQERIVNEINTTYNSLRMYKNNSTNKDVLIAERKIQIAEHKLKALKMMLAKMDSN